MTREEAIKTILETINTEVRGLDIETALEWDINSIYNSLISYLDEAMEKAKTWDARCALQDVKDYLERKEDEN
jgi:hypothetical protein